MQDAVMWSWYLHRFITCCIVVKEKVAFSNITLILFTVFVVFTAKSTH